MAEPRARVRNKGQVFATSDRKITNYAHAKTPNANDRKVTELLYAFGDSAHPLPTTVNVLDEILTDFIIETCHSAALCASYSRRQKIKVDDFRWVLRKNTSLLGRAQEQLLKERYMKIQRRVADFDALGKESAAELTAMAEMGGADAEELGQQKKRRGRKKRKPEDDGNEISGKKVHI